MNKTVELFEEMELELITFGASDILTTSGNGNGGWNTKESEADEPED